MAGTFVLKGKTGSYSFNLLAGNNQVILTSEPYTTKNGAEGGIEAVRKNAPDDAQYDRRTAKDGSPYFVLKAKNHEIIGKSEMYSSASAMENGIASVKTNAPTATIDDRT